MGQEHNPELEPLFDPHPLGRTNDWPDERLAGSGELCFRYNEQDCRN